jgi:hypothetical protein
MNNLTFCAPPQNCFVDLRTPHGYTPLPWQIWAHTDSSTTPPSPPDDNATCASPEEPEDDEEDDDFLVDMIRGMVHTAVEDAKKSIVNDVIARIARQLKQQ